MNDAHEHPDLELVRSVLSGSTAAWHALIETYSGLVQATVRRYLYDPDDIRNTVVSVFEDLYKGQLEQYTGRAALSTWLVVIARSRACDDLRRQRGRRRLPAPVQRLSERRQQIFRRYFQAGQSCEEIIAWSERQGWNLTPQEFWAVIGDLYDLVGDRALRRLDFEREADATGAISGRWLDFVDDMRRDLEQRQETLRPDTEHHLQGARDLAGRLQEELARLPERDRRILDLRFRQGYSARQIADRMQVESPRRVFYLIERAVKRLRRALVPDRGR